MVFSDLAEAFCRVIRELAIGGALSDDDICGMAARLKLPEGCVHDLHELLKQPPATEQAKLSPVQQRTISALHSETWFVLPFQHDLVLTSEGRRPGDGFADLVFGYLCSRVIKSVESSLASKQILDVFPVASAPGISATEATGDQVFVGPTWMDDCCLGLSHSSPELLESRAAVAASTLIDACLSHGMSPNLSQGKTEILFSFIGKGARAANQRFLGPVASGRLPVVGEYQSFQLRVTHSYRHLGGLVHHTGRCLHEIRRRFGMANAALTEHSRLIFHNGKISFEQRRHMFVSLILSRLTYAMETWIIDKPKDRACFRKSLHRLYKRFLGCSHDQHISYEQALADSQLPDFDILMTQARLRYLASLFNCADHAVWGILQQDSTWTSTVRDDIAWLWKMVCNTTHLPDPAQDMRPWYHLLHTGKGFGSASLLEQ